jgi:hypothetical protein
VNVASYQDVERIASELPEVTVGERYGRRTWFVGKKSFAWERPLTKADLKRLGDEPPPDGPILALATEDLAEKEAVLESDPKVFFTITHFEGYPAVLVRLKKITKRALREAIVDAWLACAPEKLADEYLAR